MSFFVSQASHVLGIPPILTEQYPKGLGPTVPELGAVGLTAHAKTSFTMITEEVEKALQDLGNPKQAILCGIETHACIAVRSVHRFCNCRVRIMFVVYSVCCVCYTVITQYDFYFMFVIMFCHYIRFIIRF